MAASSLSSRTKAPVSFASLPDDLALHILKSVALTERHTSCCLVSKHWHALVHSPQLLRSLDITLAVDSAQPLRRLRSLAAWVQQHADAGQLQLRALKLDSQLPITQFRADGAAEADALTGGMMARCTGLTSLHLAVSWDVQVGSWLACMPNLCQLWVKAWENIEVTTPRQQMPPLAELHLHASSQLLFKPWAGVPDTAVKLCLGGPTHGLPAEISALTRLRYLRLEATSAEATTGLPFLPLLSRLEQLHLRACSPLPRCLPQLTQLRALSLADDDGRYWEEDAAAELTGAVALAALPELTRLTFLAIAQMYGMLDLPAPLTALTGLRVLYWDGGTDVEGQWLDPAAAALPRGAWLDGLHTLASFPHVLLGTVPLLGSAAQLQCVGVLNWFDTEIDDMAAAMRCAAGRPGLRRLLVEIYGAKFPELCSLAASGLPAQQLPPGLRIESYDEQQICSVLMEECGADM